LLFHPIAKGFDTGDSFIRRCFDLTLKHAQTKAEPHQACALGGVPRFGVS
jgi:hypothetical protein